ncbi:MAG TPA: phosphatase PAP2 family protein [Noviherbaspirillum sp.]|jgi:undecaprenyl-diphosphatase
MPPVSALAREDAPTADDIIRTESDAAMQAQESLVALHVISSSDFPRADFGWRSVFDRLDAMEMHLVRRACRWTRFRPVRHATITVNLLGNGWLYPLIGIALAMSGIVHAWQIVVAALLATGAAHAIYAVAKRVIGRKRPFERDPTLQPLARVLDRYSFPSGHCMTLTAVLTPIIHAAPGLRPVAFAALCVLSWCRLAAAHHYPSDVLAGIGLGAVIAVPLARVLVPV